jgi:hypothetical protein
MRSIPQDNTKGKYDEKQKQEKEYKKERKKLDYLTTL